MLTDEVNQTEFTRMMGDCEEHRIRGEFSNSKSKDEVSYFCYLLIDPSMLPDQREACTLREFVSSIFYVGKGKGSRPLQHLYDAYQCKGLAKANQLEKSDMNPKKVSFLKN